MKRHSFVLAAVTISIQLSAQRDTTLLDEAVITANKYPIKTSLTGKVVSILSKEQLEQSGGKDLSQVLAEQAGIYIAGANSNTGKDKSLYLRGARIEHTLIMIDGVPVYDPSGIGSNFDIRNLSLDNIERIEILKGSQSTLYGSDAIAGVINIITKKTGLKKIGGNFLAGYGSNATARSHAGVNGRSGIVDYNASYSFRDTKGINEAVNTNNSPAPDKDGFTQHSFQAGVGIRPADKISIQPFFRFSRIKGDIDQGAFTDELDYTYSQSSWQTGSLNQFIIGKTVLNIVYSYNHIDRIYLDDSAKSRNGYDTWSEGKYRGQEHFADACLVTSINERLKLTGGIDFRASGSHQQYSSEGFFGPYKSEYSSDSLNQQQTSLYAALNWNNRSGFTMEAGSRVNFHSSYGSHAVFNINPSYLINKKIKLFANISSAYRTPSLYQLFSEYGNQSLQPEAAITVEGGLQYYSPGNLFTGRAVVFSRNVNDVIFFLYNPVTFTSQYINQDKQKDHGFELEALYHVTPKISLKGFYTYVKGEITTKMGATDTTYDNLLRRPKSSIGVNLAVQVMKNFFLSSGLRSTGRRKDTYFDNTSYTTVNITLKSYIVWDIYAEYGFIHNRLKFFADFRNISGSRYTEISGFNTLGFNGYGGARFTF